MTVMFLFFIILITESAISKLTWSFSTHTVFMRSQFRFLLIRHILLRVCHILLRKAILCFCSRLFFTEPNIQPDHQANDLLFPSGIRRICLAWQTIICRFYLFLMPRFQSFAFQRKYENRFWALSMKFIRFQDITTIWLTQNSGLSFTRCLYSFCMQLSKTRIKIYIPISRQATQQRKKSTALLIIYTATMMRNCRLIPWLTDSF